MIETQFDTKVRMLQTDWGGEFQAFTNTLCKFGILHRVSCPSTSQQNGRVERKHRHVVEVGLSLLAHASIPLKYWPFAFQSALYLINRLPSSVLNFSLHIRLFTIVYQIILFFASMVALVILFSTLLIAINLHTDQLNAPLLAIVLSIKDIYV